MSKIFTLSIWAQAVGIWAACLLMSFQSFAETPETRRESTVVEYSTLKSHSQIPDLLVTFAKVKAGRFLMGSPYNEKGRNYRETQHWVLLTKDFQIQTTETTQLQYFYVMGHNPSHFRKPENCADEYVEIDGTSLCPNHPVEQVSWHDAKEFIFKLNKSNDSYTYSLPTEAEWEYAARAYSTTAFNLGRNISTQLVNYKNPRTLLDKIIGKKKTYRGQTVAIASLPNANDLGLYDMHGNVAEWVEDKFGEYEYDDNGSVTDPRGASSGSLRVARGGDWANFAPALRSASRFAKWPSSRHKTVGFRLVRTPK